MPIDLCNKLIDNDLTKKELLNRIEIQKTDNEDFNTICELLSKAFNLSSKEEAMFQLKNSHARLDESIKLVDKETNNVYGLLIFTEYPIQIGSPIQLFEKEISQYLNDFKQVNGHSFIIDERLRGCGLDKKMLFHNIEFLSKNYDFIWIGVEKSLKSLEYWHRLGFVDIFKMDEATFLILPLNKKMIERIFI